MTKLLAFILAIFCAQAHAGPFAIAGPGGGSGTIPLTSLAAQATNTVVGNATSGSASPTALPVGTCSTAASALIWTTNTGFGCNTNITAFSAAIVTNASQSNITSLGTLTSLAVTRSTSDVAAVTITHSGTSTHQYGLNVSSGTTVADYNSRFLRGDGGAAFLDIMGNGTMFAYALTAASGTPSSICMNAATKEITLNAALTCTVSSARFKDDIRPFGGDGLKMVMAMTPDTFLYKDRLDRRRLGLMAEDLAAIDPRLSEWDGDGRPNSIDFPAMMATFAKAIQQQQAQIEALSREVAALRETRPVIRQVEFDMTRTIH